MDYNIVREYLDNRTLKILMTAEREKGLMDFSKNNTKVKSLPSFRFLCSELSDKSKEFNPTIDFLLDLYVFHRIIFFHHFLNQEVEPRRKVFYTIHADRSQTYLKAGSDPEINFKATSEDRSNISSDFYQVSVSC